jgi:hypothetical protein
VRCAFAFALAGAVALAGGCGDDREKVAAAIFRCDATSSTADLDCGEGYVCYSAAQALGGSFCAPRCDPADPKTCAGGVCTVGGACLSSCIVGAPDQCGGSGSPLLCARGTGYQTDGGLVDGVCTPASSLCATDNDCQSPIYDVCGTNSNMGEIGYSRPHEGSVCIQGGCVTAGVACAPGSSCIQKVLPATFGSIPDVCTPNCVSRAVGGGDAGVVDECVIGMTCLDDVLPQTHRRVCVPGLPGILCRDSLGCVYGRCQGWEDVAPEMAEFRTCDPPCSSDDDCLQYDAPSNPNAFGKFMCRGGRCRSQLSPGFPELCVNEKEPCKLDPEAECRLPVELGGGAKDAGASTCGFGLGSGSGSTLVCLRHCGDDQDCAQLSEASHVRHVCVIGICLPVLPYLTPCTSTSQCLPGLSCEQPPKDPPYPVCTLRCASSSDCAAHPALGSAFACLQGLCVPRTEAGCAPPVATPELCLSGHLEGGRCLSPQSWPCASDDQCASKSCHGGRCG